MEANNKEDLFIEIRGDDEQSSPLPRLVKVYVAQVEPSRCRTLLKILSQDIPLGSDNNGKSFDFTHLKRVQKVKSNNNGTESPSKKKQKQEDSSSSSRSSNDILTPALLEVLLRDVDSLEGELGAKLIADSTTKKDIIEVLKTKYDLPSIDQRMVPGRPPESHQEWQEFQTQYWPTIFFPQRSKEHLDQQLKLSPDEIQKMQLGMEQAIQDGGAIVQDPTTGKVVACSTDERRCQIEANHSTQPSILENSLATPILFAIQGVSRIEREKAIAAGMGSSEFQKGQYLCTGYDLYTIKEPTVFEAMSLVHSRIRRVVFGESSPNEGGMQPLSIHALPSTNHHYRAFHCRPGSDLNRQCTVVNASHS